MIFEVPSMVPGTQFRIILACCDTYLDVLPLLLSVTLFIPFLLLELEIKLVAMNILGKQSQLNCSPSPFLLLSFSPPPDIKRVFVTVWSNALTMTVSQQIDQESCSCSIHRGVSSVPMQCWHHCWFSESTGRVESPILAPPSPGPIFPPSLQRDSQSSAQCLVWPSPWCGSLPQPIC